MVTAKVSPTGQITLPRQIRETLGLKPGQHVLLQVEGQTVLLRSLEPSARDLAGSLRSYARGSVPGQEVRKSVKERVAHDAAEEG